MMNYIQQAFKGQHEFWRYLVGSLIVFAAALIGQFPLTVVVIVKVFGEGGDLMSINEQTMYSILDANLFLFLMLLSFVFAFIGFIIAIKYLHKQTLLSVTTARPKVDWKRIFFAFFLWGILSSGMVILDYFMSPEDYELNFQWQRFAVLAVIAIALIPIQTSVEEYIFRGYLIQGFGVVSKDKLFPLGFIISFITL